MLFVDFNSYNAALNIHMAGRITFEFLETGGVRPRAVFSPIKLFRYRNGGPGEGGRTLALEVLTLLIFLGYMAYVCCPQLVW
jgi:hypothetical protein